MSKLAVIALLIAIAFMYFSFNLASIVTYTGLFAGFLFVTLESMKTMSPDADYDWKDNKSFVVFSGSIFVIFSIIICISTLKSLA